MDLRVRALETLLTQKGYIDPAALDVLIETYQTRIGPRNGARVVARAWIDPAFDAWLRRDASAAIASLGYTGRQGEHMVALQNTPQRHNLVVCTLCSCYPWPVLGLPPTWYKSAPYRSRAVRIRAACWPTSASTLPEATEIRVWRFDRRGALPRDPDAPAGTEGFERRTTRRTGDARLDDRHRPGLCAPAAMSYVSHADLGGQRGHGAVVPEPEGELFHAAWEPRALALTLAMGATGCLEHRHQPRCARDAARLRAA